MGDEPTLEDLNRRLAEIQDRLLELDPDDFAARHGLHTDRDHLRALARHSQSDRDTHRSSEELRAELKARQAALEEIKKGMVNTGGMAGGGGGGSGSYEGPLGGMKINDAIRRPRAPTNCCGASPTWRASSRRGASSELPAGTVGSPGAQVPAISGPSDPS